MVDEIRKRARKKGLSIAELERSANLGRSTIPRWDRFIPSVDKVARVASVLGCTVDDLLRDDTIAPA